VLEELGGGVFEEGGVEVEVVMIGIVEIALLTELQ
jgi:hypothetical protein